MIQVKLPSMLCGCVNNIYDLGNLRDVTAFSSGTLWNSSGELSFECAESSSSCLTCDPFKEGLLEQRTDASIPSEVGKLTFTFEASHVNSMKMSRRHAI
jgi:hypothetical protein